MTDKNNANLINQTSGSFEYYTPEPWPTLARELMGAIDLDPASNPIANKRIQAALYYSKADDGLTRSWHGRVFMNHPFHRGENACPDDRSKCVKKICKPGKKTRGHHIDEAIPGNEEWINKLLTEYNAGRVSEAVIICFSSSSESWFRPLLKFPQLFPRGRVNYELADGSKAIGVTKGSVITYLGPNFARFSELFGPHGDIKIHYTQTANNQ